MEGDKRRVLDELSRRQLGLVTRAQVLEAGFSSSAIDRRLASGELEELFWPGDPFANLR